VKMYESDEACKECKDNVNSEQVRF